MMDLLNRAVQVASTAHDKTYRKKKADLPYISHPYMVAMYLMKEGVDEEIVAAAVLHDTVEDTDITLDDIENEFGKQVAELVEGCTEDKSKTWRERKQGQLNKIRVASYGVLMIKLADKVHNIFSTLQDLNQEGRAAIFQGFNSGIENQKWYYKGLVEAFETRHEVNSLELFHRFKTYVSEVFD